MTKTAERFGQSVGEVRQMAAEVQRQLEETRTEMRRGVLELPDGDRRGGQRDASRRLRSDQGAQGAHRGGRGLGRRFRRRRSDASQAGRRAEAPRKAEPARASDRAGLLDDEANADRSPSRTGRPQRRARGRPARAAPQPAARRPPACERSQSGWLSNLLAAASRDEAPQPASAPRREGALEGISLDVAKYVDTEAAAEMWDRWRGGDASAVSRRLYTAAGQQTFDEIRRALPQRSAVPERRHALYPGIRAPAGQNRPERPRRDAIARDAALRRRQGLHDAGARLGAARLGRAAQSGLR